MNAESLAPSPPHVGVSIHVAVPLLRLYPSPHGPPLPMRPDAPEPVMPDASPTPAGPGWRGWFATAGLVAVGILLLGTAFVPWWLSDPARVTAWVRRNVPALRGSVEMSRATFTWLGPIVFEDVVVVPRNGAREPVTIRRVEAEHGIVAFLLSGGDCGRVRIEGLESHLVFDDDRHSNVTGLFYDPASPAGPPPKESGLRMRLEVEDAVVRIEGPWAADPWTSDPVDVSLRLARSESGDGSEWTLEPTTLLASAELQPDVAQGVLAYVAPILADATRTSGRFSLVLDGGTFPVGAPERARFSGSLTMHEVDLGPGPMVTGILDLVTGGLQAPPAIRIADDSRIAFRMEERRVWHEGLEFGVPLPRGRRLDLTSKGSVGLDDQSLDLSLALPIPDGLPGDRPLLSALGGKTVSLGIVGKLGAPKVDFDGSIRHVATDVAADVIGGVIDRIRQRRSGTPEGSPATAPAAPPRAPRPGWTPTPAEAGGERDSAAESDRGAEEASGSIPPPPRPGWSPDSTARDARAEERDRPARVPRDAGARPIDRGNEASAEAAPGNPGRSGAAEMLDQLRDRIAPQTSADPQADRVIDLVGGIIDEFARRRAERAATRPEDGAAAGARPGGAEGQSSPAAPPEGPRRGRLLRRLLRPEAGPAPTPAPAPPQ